MKRLNGVVAVPAIVAIVACTRPTPTVMIDGSWNEDYAQNSCVSKGPGKLACEAENKLGILQFERSLTTQFAASPECSGIRVVQTAPGAPVPTLPADYWRLSINYAGDQAHQPWLMQDNHNKNSQQGSGTPKDTAITVCGLLKGKGAKDRDNVGVGRVANRIR